MASAADIFTVEPEDKSLFKRRTIARGIDSLTVFLTGFPTGFALYLHFLAIEEATGQAVTKTGPMVLYIVCTLAALAAVHCVWECLWLTWFGATPGKLLMRLRVVDTETGFRPGFMQALRRSTDLLYFGLYWYFGYPFLLVFAWIWSKHRPAQPWDAKNRTRVIDAASR